MTLAQKSLNKPDETRQFQGKGNMAVVTIGDATVGRGTFEPGWKWSSNVKPIPRTMVPWKLLRMLAVSRLGSS